MKNLVSVIVPVYKVEKYLRRCVDSIISQTYKNLEIILVDDGSPDKCGEICDEYSRQDSRIKVIHKENGGLSDARNKGLEIAKGEYISFVDSDDWVSPYYIENLYVAITKDNSKIAVAQYVEIFEGDSFEYKETTQLINYTKCSDEECLEQMLYQRRVDTCACAKIYRSEIFNNLQYPKGLLYEDIVTTYHAINLAKDCAIIDNIDYCYFQRKEGIQNSTFNERKLDAVRNGQLLKSLIDENYPRLQKAVICRYFSIVCNIYFQIRDKNHESIKKNLWKEIKTYRKDVLQNSKARKKARLAAIISYFGHSFFSIAYNLTQWRSSFSR